MPRNGKKFGAKAGRSRSLDTNKSDFTIYDYAHSSLIRSPVSASGRLKKGEANAFHVQAKKACGKSMLSENSLDWFERDISDFDLSDEELNAPFNENKEIDLGGKDHGGRRKHQILRECFSGGSIYPLDVWFLIGKHIRPEEVATFSAICRYSHVVVHSARFWTCLYKKYYLSSVDLPISLQPSTLDRVHGLKGRVVRALFYFYPPFQNRLRCMAPFENDPDCLEGSRCIRMWHQQIRQLWHFYLKFERTTSSSCCPVFPNRQKIRPADSLRAEADALYNPEEDSIVLQVVSPGFVLLPDVIGQVLIKAFVSVGHEMRSHRLKLIFNTTHVRSTKTVLANGTTVMMDPVTNIHVLRWWDPKYPCRF